MKKSKQWQKPEADVMKPRKTKKTVGSSRKVEVRYSLGIGPVPPAMQELV
ncbi:MAG: hypothetical protein WAU61_10355 [Smithella sp.]